MFCIQVPTREMHCPHQKSLKFLWYIAGKARLKREPSVPIVMICHRS
jgi:hypothetical protein